MTMYTETQERGWQHWQARSTARDAATDTRIECEAPPAQRWAQKRANPASTHQFTASSAIKETANQNGLYSDVGPSAASNTENPPEKNLAPTQQLNRVLLSPSTTAQKQGYANTGNRPTTCLLLVKWNARYSSAQPTRPAQCINITS